MNFEFKIFGTPHSFDLYRPGEKDINYFRIFYNGSKEKAKLTVHRMASGRVSYSYLRYHFLSNGRRTGGFFGMSVVFKDEYCKDVEGLYKLFDLVYDTILANKILLEALPENPDSPQAKYLVKIFEDAESEVKRIENTIRKNLENHFINDMCPVNDLPPPKPENDNLVRLLNDKKGNASFEAALREYAWVSISSEYTIRPETNLSPEEIAYLESTDKEKLEKYPEIANNMAKGDFQDATALYEQVEKCMKIMQPYLRKRKQFYDYDGLYSRFEEFLKNFTGLKEFLENVPTIKVAVSDGEGQTENDPKNDPKDDENPPVTEGEPVPPPPPKQNPSKKMKGWFGKIRRKLKHRNKSRKLNHRNKISKESIIAIVVTVVLAALVIVALCKVVFPSRNFPSFEYRKDSMVQNSSKPVTTQETLPKAVASKKETQAEDEKQVAINQLRESAKNVFENSSKGSITKIEGYKSAITLLQGLKSLGADEQFKNDSAKYAKQTITYYSNEMEKANQDNSKKKYANYILEIDSKNKEALKVKNPSSSTTLKVSEKPKDTTPPTIHVKKGNQALTATNGVITIQVGDKIEVTAKQGDVDCSIGEWSWSNNNKKIELSGNDKNPLTIKARAGTNDGPVKLTYKDKQTGKESGISIRIM